MDAVSAQVAALVARARAAQQIATAFSQVQLDQLARAAGWAIIEPARNQALAERAVADTGLGNVPDKFAKNHRKTLGLLRDLESAKTTGLTRDDAATGIAEYARPIGVIAAITPSTNPGATPANKIINALKCGNAIIVAPSPKGAGTCTLLLQFIHAELDKLKAPRDLVQMLPTPITKAATHALMAQADLIVATGSQANIRAAYSSGTPALGVGAGNVAVIVDETADFSVAAQLIAKSKTFDNATSCSSENAVVLVGSARAPMREALRNAGGFALNTEQKTRLQRVLWPDGAHLSATLIAQSAVEIARAVEIEVPANARFLMVDEIGIGAAFPFSGEKLSPVLTVFETNTFEDACKKVNEIYAFQGAGHSVGYHGTSAEHVSRIAQHLSVARVIVNQAHAIATGGSFDNGLPFSLSMGCGSWGGNSFSENLHWRHFLNITRVVRPIVSREPTVEDVFAAYWRAVGK